MNDFDWFYENLSQFHIYFMVEKIFFIFFSFFIKMVLRLWGGQPSVILTFIDNMFFFLTIFGKALD